MGFSSFPINKRYLTYLQLSVSVPGSSRRRQAPTERRRRLGVKKTIFNNQIISKKANDFLNFPPDPKGGIVRLANVQAPA